MLKVVPVKKSSASDQVFEQLKDNLIQGTWKPGEKLASENELASLFGVSRITIRQALSRLAALGLVETRLGEGSFVEKAGSFHPEARAVRAGTAGRYCRPEGIFTDFIRDRFRGVPRGSPGT